MEMSKAKTLQDVAELVTLASEGLSKAKACTSTDEMRNIVYDGLTVLATAIEPLSELVKAEGLKANCFVDIQFRTPVSLAYLRENE